MIDPPYPGGGCVHNNLHRGQALSPWPTPIDPRIEYRYNLVSPCRPLNLDLERLGSRVVATPRLRPSSSFSSSSSSSSSLSLSPHRCRCRRWQQTSGQRHRRGGRSYSVRRYIQMCAAKVMGLFIRCFSPEPNNVGLAIILFQIVLF